MELNHLFFRISGLEVKAVNVLSDDAVEFTQASPFPQWQDGPDWVGLFLSVHTFPSPSASISPGRFHWQGNSGSKSPQDYIDPILLRGCGSPEFPILC